MKRPSPNDSLVSDVTGGSKDKGRVKSIASAFPLIAQLEPTVSISEPGETFNLPAVCMLFTCAWGYALSKTNVLRRVFLLFHPVSLDQLSNFQKNGLQTAAKVMKSQYVN